ncbi:serine/threonine-protein kinase [Streptomyces sp. MUM 2J]|uniref:serine/threonine-protein kinase n=1 Tax=Streptomyces sp. MUM 2J TaxID=2791987 RepID=UPI001F03EBCD|nr:serine/threonine-protein kinase [Streptomyces sp. MUM 2J]MCH0561950.1 serine/threonine protein kinase [Streptomyces sp. MUM 2J]
MPNVVIGGHYRLVRKLGEGGMGQVWLAFDEHLRRHVAIKRMFMPDFDEMTRRTLHQRLIKEARNAARIKHPDVVQVFGTIEEDGEPLIIMEYLEYPNLAAYVAENGILEARAFAPTALRLLKTVQEIHGQKILHRDFKPANLLVFPEASRITILDFGISRAVDDTRTVAQGAMGTVAFMAPEHLATGEASELTDTWSVAMTLYWALTGELPPQRHKIPPLQGGTPTEKAIMGMLAVNPEHRWTLSKAVKYLNAASRKGELATRHAVDKKRLERKPVYTAWRRDSRNRLISASVAVAVTTFAAIVVSMNGIHSGAKESGTAPRAAHSPSPEPTLSGKSKTPPPINKSSVELLQTGGLFRSDEITIDLKDGWIASRDDGGKLRVSSPSGPTYAIRQYGKSDLDVVARAEAKKTFLGVKGEFRYNPWPAKAEVTWTTWTDCGFLGGHKVSCPIAYMERLESQNQAVFGVEVQGRDPVTIRPDLVDLMDRVTLSP